MPACRPTHRPGALRRPSAPLAGPGDEGCDAFFDPDGLEALALSLEATAHDAGWGPAASLARVTPAGVAVRPLPHDDDVVSALAGFTAPPDWRAIGLISEGWARPLTGMATSAGATGGGDCSGVHDEGAVPGPGGGRPRPGPHRVEHRSRARTVMLVQRDGTTAVVVRTFGGRPQVMPRWAAGVSGGRLHDFCLRALGLATAPPPRSTLELWAVAWLDDVLAVAARRPAELDRFAAVAALFPAATMLSAPPFAGAVGPAEMSPPQLVEVGQRLGDACSWSLMRSACAERCTALDGRPSALAAWFDAGSFARWALAELPSVADLALAVLALVAPPAADGVAATLAGWGFVPLGEA
ncbi:MAG: hypothetical protein ACT4PW_03585 [Acidimicrobiia bacterium]